MEGNDINKKLTEIAVNYHDDKLIADKVFPTVFVQEKSGKYHYFDSHLKCPPCQDKNLNFLSEPDISF